VRRLPRRSRATDPPAQLVQLRQPEALGTSTPTPPHLRIQRINPKNGQTMWEYYRESAPLDVQFDANTIELVFKKEVQVLKYLVF
jgi:hypothetical protein